MSSFLAVCILLVGHLFSSSATSLKTIKLASEESSQAKSLIASPIGSSVTTLDSNITKLANLDGYVVDVRYTDSSCSTFSFAEQQVLNKCFRYSATQYKYITATSTLVTKNTYTDAKCTLGGSNILNVYESKVCNAKKIIFIAESIALTSNVALGFQLTPMPTCCAVRDVTLEFAAAVTAGAVYLLGLIASFWLPEPSADEAEH